MEEKEIIISDAVIVFLEKLTYTLHQEEYFGFLETAEAYVDNLIDGIYRQVLSDNLFKTPGELQQYGNYYIKIKGSKRTTWYVFFNKKKRQYLIQFITNNHTPQSAHLNKL